MEQYGKKRLAIIGAGGHGKVCASIAQKMNSSFNCKTDWFEIVFIDNQKEGYVNNIKIIKPNYSFTSNNYEVFVAIGDNRKRRELLEEYINKGFNVVTLKDSSAVVNDLVKIGKGTVVMPGVVINTNVSIGDGVIINSSSIIEHDCSISDYVHISPGAVLAGNVTVNELSWIGANSTIINNKKIGTNVVIGAGSVVTKDISDNTVAYGVPAKACLR